jgi:DAK2 domain fusion protein YloV
MADVLTHLDATGLQLVVRAFRDALVAWKDVVNRLNVYPVPDGDTGTNMSLTLVSVCEELDRAALDGDMAATCKAVSHGSLMGARGNSGVILSQILRGVSEVLREHDKADGPTLAAALEAAATAAYGAVMRPVEGTILTVVREAAEGAVSAGATSELVAVLEAAKAQGADALARTPEMLPVLAEAGVVDAGGSGFLLLLDAALHVVDGRPLPEPDPELVAAASAAGAANSHSEGHGSQTDELRYEVMYFLEAPDETIPAFKDVWAGLGDSIVVVGGDGLWNCHIHTDDIGSSIEAALDAGRPRQIRVTDLIEQVGELEEERWVQTATAAGGVLEQAPHANKAVPTAVVAVATGAGIRRIFNSLGAQRVVTGGQSMNPSTAQLLEAVEASPAEQVVILPNNKNIIAVAEQVQSQTAKQVVVVRTCSVTEGFAALLAYDPEADAEANGGAMGEAASEVVAGEVTRAVRDSSSDVGPIRQGDYLGIAQEGILSVHAELAPAATELLDKLVTEDHEVVTIIEGEGASAAVTRRITSWLDEHRPDVSAEIHHGGQPLYPYLFGVE